MINQFPIINNQSIDKIAINVLTYLKSIKISLNTFEQFVQNASIISNLISNTFYEVSKITNVNLIFFILLKII